MKLTSTFAVINLNEILVPKLKAFKLVGHEQFKITGPQEVYTIADNQIDHH